MNIHEIKRSLIALVLVFILWSGIRMTDDSAVVFDSSSQYSCKYYDGEGNQIPNYAVKLLVRNQFVILDNSELDTINKYFPPLLDMHKCDYEYCPYKGHEAIKWPQHGCGNCDQGSDCWALDSIHFRHPTFSYDECEDFLFNTH